MTDHSETTRSPKGTLTVFFGLIPGEDPDAAVARDIARMENTGAPHGFRIEIIEERAARDLDDLLSRRPERVFVKDPSGANPPGFRHLTRYQDIGELRSRGIDVMTAVDIRVILSHAGKREGRDRAWAVNMQGFVEAHGGSISAANREGGGALFVIEIKRFPTKNGDE